jgi:uncharacterized protein YciI
MFIIELIYKVDLAEIDAHMTAHVEFLTKYYRAGSFLVSGRKIPRDGGIIIAVGTSRQQIEAIAKEDPFYTHGLADVRIVEFRASQRASDIQQRIDRTEIVRSDFEGKRRHRSLRPRGPAGGKLSR